MENKCFFFWYSNLLLIRRENLTFVYNSNEISTKKNQTFRIFLKQFKIKFLDFYVRSQKKIVERAQKKCPFLKYFPKISLSAPIWAFPEKTLFLLKSPPIWKFFAKKRQKMDKKVKTKKSTKNLIKIPQKIKKKVRIPKKFLKIVKIVLWVVKTLKKWKIRQITCG